MSAPWPPFRLHTLCAGRLPGPFLLPAELGYLPQPSNHQGDSGEASRFGAGKVGRPPGSGGFPWKAHLGLYGPLLMRQSVASTIDTPTACLVMSTHAACATRPLERPRQRCVTSPRHVFSANVSCLLHLLDVCRCWKSSDGGARFSLAEDLEPESSSLSLLLTLRSLHFDDRPCRKRTCLLRNVALLESN